MSKNSFTKLAEDDGDDLPTIARVNSAPLPESPLEDLTAQRADPDLEEKGRRTGDHTPLWIFVSAFFIIVSTILGTGILGLPIKIAKTGFRPFLVGYTITCFMQAFTFIYTMEVLQRAHALNCATHVGTDPRSLLPDLHGIGQLYLHPALRIVFDSAVMVHFISILITYGIAGSQAYINLFSTSHAYELRNILMRNLTAFRGNPESNHIMQIVLLPFVGLLSCLLVFGYNMIHSIISMMTLVKGSLLTLLVLVTGYIAYKVSITPTNDWIFIGSPLLVGTVALGGGMNLLPFIYAKLVAYNRNDMVKLTITSVAALVFVYALNVMWCYYMLHIVPQSELQLEGELGHIATIPLLNVIETSYKSLRWLGLIVQIFVASSITVSFIAVGTGLKHTLDGMAHSFTAPASHEDSAFVTGLRSLGTRVLGSHFNNALVRNVLYVLSFGLVLAVAEANPKSFFVVLEHVTSLALNLESGVFVVLMMEVARMDSFPIVWTLPRWLYMFRWAVLMFFLFACVYNLIDLLVERLV